MYIEKVLALWVQLMKNGVKNKCCVYIILFSVCLYIYIIYTVSHRSEYIPHIFVNILLYLFMWQHWRKCQYTSRTPLSLSLSLSRSLVHSVCSVSVMMNFCARAHISLPLRVCSVSVQRARAHISLSLCICSVFVQHVHTHLSLSLRVCSDSVQRVAEKSRAKFG